MKKLIFLAILIVSLFGLMGICYATGEAYITPESISVTINLNTIASLSASSSYDAAPITINVYKGEVSGPNIGSFGPLNVVTNIFPKRQWGPIKVNLITGPVALNSNYTARIVIGWKGHGYEYIITSRFTGKNTNKTVNLTERADGSIAGCNKKW